MAKKRVQHSKSKAASKSKGKPAPPLFKSPALWVRLAYVVAAVLILWGPLRVGHFFIKPDKKSVAEQKRSIQAPKQMSVTFSFNGVKTVRGYSGWSYKLDNNPTRNMAISGNPLKVRDKVYQRGLGTHAPSEIVFGLDGKVKRFECLAGVDWGGGSSAKVIFRVNVDGKQAYESRAMTYEGKPVTIDLDVTGAKELALLVNGAELDSWGHSDWLDLKFTK